MTGRRGARAAYRAGQEGSRRGHVAVTARPLIGAARDVRGLALRTRNAIVSRAVVSQSLGFVVVVCLGVIVWD